MFWSAPEYNCCVLTCLKNRTKEDKAPWLDSNELNTAYVKRLPVRHALTPLPRERLCGLIAGRTWFNPGSNPIRKRTKFRCILQAAFETSDLTDTAENRAKMFAHYERVSFFGYGSLKCRRLNYLLRHVIEYCLCSSFLFPVLEGPYSSLICLNVESNQTIETEDLHW